MTNVSRVAHGVDCQTTREEEAGLTTHQPTPDTTDTAAGRGAERAAKGQTSAHSTEGNTTD